MTDVPRRTVLRQTALAALAGASPRQTASARSTDHSNSGIGIVATRGAMAALEGTHPGYLVYLAEPGREGMFRCVVQPGLAVDDPLQGLTVPCRQQGLQFVRVWDGTHGMPEWFGAQPGDEASDCADAIEACYRLCPVTELSSSDYFIRRGLHFSRSGRTVRGVGAFAETLGRGTRIILHRSASGVSHEDVLLVGSSSAVAVPGHDAPSDCHFSYFTLVRDGACTPHPSGNITLYPTGLRAAFVFHCTFRSIASLESSVGFYIGGVVYTKFDDCYSLRVKPGTSAVKDYCVGYYLNGHVSFGYAGGNASLYMNRCLASDQHPQHVNPTGLLARGAFVDTFLDGFESARMDTGIACQGDGARGIGNTADLHIRTPILDGCARYGIDLDLGGTFNASIDVIDPYIYAAAAGGKCGITVHDGAGLVTISSGQVHGDFTEGSLHLSKVRGTTIQGVKVHQAIRPVVIDKASGLLVEPQINNDAKSSPYFAVSCHGVSRSIIRPVTIGANGPSFKGGVELDATCQYTQIDPSAIDPECFQSRDSQFKVWFDGADARNGEKEKGFLAAGNRINGIFN